jgi:phosphoribosylformylglycinamidine cyclo-ligase
VTEDGASYRAAGVDLDAADAAVEAIRPHVARTTRPEVLGGIGGFGGLFALDPSRWRAPVMVTATDGVGTKLALARQLDRHDTVGRDLVAMVVDDIVVTGAEPLVFLDYLAVGRLEPAHAEAVVAGIADGCEEAGCALVGGEMAEHPGVMAPGEYDLAGFGVGIVERDDLLGPDRVRPGDALVALASSGLHSNGFSLVRHVVADLDLDATHGLSGAPSLGDALLTPTRIYTRDCLSLAAATEVHALCHITGGGVPGNLPRVLPEGLGARVDAATFRVPEVVSLLGELGGIAPAELWRVFNMGAGMIAVVPDADAAVHHLSDCGIVCWECGEVTAEPGVTLAGVANS